MTADPPRSVRGLVLRIVGTLLALVVLYVLSSGPALYLEQRRRLTTRGVGPVMELDPQTGRPRLAQPNSLFWVIYRPLFRVTANTPLRGPLMKYRQWWLQRAAPRAHEKR
jgi:hypothetical protein